MKQHSVLDVLCALAVCALGYLAAYRCAAPSHTRAAEGAQHFPDSSF